MQRLQPLRDRQMQSQADEEPKQLPYMITQQNSLLPLVVLRMLDQLEQLFPQQRSLLSILKRNFAWRMKVETTG
jgi:hypothetical protein